MVEFVASLILVTEVLVVVVVDFVTTALLPLTSPSSADGVEGVPGDDSSDSGRDGVEAVVTADRRAESMVHLCVRRTSGGDAVIHTKGKRINYMQHRRVQAKGGRIESCWKPYSLSL